MKVRKFKLNIWYGVQYVELVPCKIWEEVYKIRVKIYFKKKPYQFK